MQGVYRIRNKLDSKRYIGSAQDFDERWDTHRKELRKGTHYNPHLQNAWNKYGEEKFVFEVVEEVKSSRKDSFDCEQEHLDEWFPTGLLYNVSPVVGGGAMRGTGWHHTEETVAKLSKANTGKKHSEEHKAKLSKINSGENNPNYGKIKPEEEKRKISATLMGHEVTEKTRAKMSKSHMGLEAWNKGKTGIYSEATLEQMSKSKRGEKNANYGNPRSKEVKTKIGKANAGPYPAFYNIKTGEFIPAGNNLSKLCREYRIGYATLWEVKVGIRVKTREGWILAE